MDGLRCLINWTGRLVLGAKVGSSVGVQRVGTVTSAISPNLSDMNMIKVLLGTV